MGLPALDVITGRVSEAEPGQNDVEDATIRKNEFEQEEIIAASARPSSVIRAAAASVVISAPKNLSSSGRSAGDLVERAAGCPVQA